MSAAFAVQNEVQWPTHEPEPRNPWFDPAALVEVAPELKPLTEDQLLMEAPLYDLVGYEVDESRAFQEKSGDDKIQKTPLSVIYHALRYLKERGLGLWHKSLNKVLGSVHWLISHDLTPTPALIEWVAQVQPIIVGLLGLNTQLVRLRKQFGPKLFTKAVIALAGILRRGEKVEKQSLELLMLRTITPPPEDIAQALEHIAGHYRQVA